MRLLWGLAAVVTALSLTSCTTNSPGAMGYTSRAATSAENMASAVATGELLARLGRQGRLLGPYAKTATVGAADEADSIRSRFDQVQPPDRASSRLRDQVLDLFDQSSSALADLRIAARQGNLQALGKFEHRLSTLEDELQSFQKAHER